jgi:D-alanyl-lipoteichoic acid acyltransferase DltB (MBOAT superfamily)
VPPFIWVGVILAGYVLAARVSLDILPGALRAWTFALLNVGTYVSLVTQFGGSDESRSLLALSGFYVLLVALSYLLMLVFSKRSGWEPWLAFSFPLLVLIFLKYLPFTWTGLLALAQIDRTLVGIAVIGLSYMAFRLSYLVIQVRNGVVTRPGPGEYLGFAFFLPTVVLGPINPFSVHQQSFEKPDRSSLPVGRCLLRIVVGGTKCQFLANLANQVSYSGLFLDGKRHSFIDLPVAMVAYYLYLYWNFSGFCDIAIGVAGLIGIRVKENFDNPFAARSVREFWNRWHITLSEYIRDIVFSPLAKVLVRRLGTAKSNAAIAIAIFVSFTIVGVWHGVGWRFLAFGLIHAVGLIVNHYYTVWLKRRLGPEGYRRYNQNRWINAAAVAGTFVYVTGALFIFANNNYYLRSVLRAVFGYHVGYHST